MGLRANVGMISLITPIAGRIMMYTDRKSTRLNSSHSQISYAVFCLKKKTKNTKSTRYDRNERNSTPVETATEKRSSQRTANRHSFNARRQERSCGCRFARDPRHDLR